MVKHKTAISHRDTEKPIATSTTQVAASSTQTHRHSVDDIILSLANAYENKRARQVNEWERFQVSRWQRAA